MALAHAQDVLAAKAADRVEPTPRPPAMAGAIAATSLGFVVVQLDVTIVNVALPQMGATLGAIGIAGLQWVVDAYTLALAALLLAGGSLGDRFGVRRAYVLGIAIFGAASLICALAPSVSALIAGRALQGAGAALILPASLSIIVHASGGNAVARAAAIGWWSAIGGVVSAAGPVVGGILTTAFGWPSIFLVNLPLCILAAWATAAFVRETPRSAAQPFDWPGQILAMAMLAAVTGAAIEAGRLGWTHPAVLTCFAIALSAGALFILVESRARAPMLPLRFFRNRTFSAAVAIGFMMNMTFYGSIFVLSFYFQLAQRYSATQTGLALLPFTIIILANLVSGRLSRLVAPRVPILAGLGASALGFAMLHGVKVDTPYLHILPGLLLLGIGAGVATPALTSALLGTVDSGRSATASALLNVARQVGSAIGVAVFGAFVAGSSQDIAAGASLAFDLSAGLRLMGLALAVFCFAGARSR